MKKWIAAICALAMIFALCACGKTSEEQANTAAEETEVGMANPMKEATAESILEEIGVEMLLPAGATDEAYYIIENGDSSIAEMSFTYDGVNITYRISPAADAQDISGMYYNWTQTETVTLENEIEATAQWIDGEQGIIIWYDVVPGLNYSISVDKNASLELLTNLAEMLFVPVQTDVG